MSAFDMSGEDWYIVDAGAPLDFTWSGLGQLRGMIGMLRLVDGAWVEVHGPVHEAALIALFSEQHPTTYRFPTLR